VTNDSSQASHAVSTSSNQTSGENVAIQVSFRPATLQQTM